MAKFLKKLFKYEKSKSMFDEIVRTNNVEGMYSLMSKLPNPDFVLRKTGKGIACLREVASHYQVTTCIGSRKSGITSLNWELSTADYTGKNIDIYEKMFKKLDIHSLIESILDAPLFGFVPFEIIWEKEENFIIPKKIEAKPQEWFYFDTDNNFYFRHKDYKNGMPIELNNSSKFLVARNKPTYLNPYGEALLSRCFWNVAFINGGMEFWIRFVEKYAMPYLIGKYDRSMNKEEKQSLLKALSNMIQDAIAVIPNDGSVDIIEPGGKGASADIFDNVIKRCENNISKVLLGQTLTTDVGDKGSYAASNTHAQIRQDIVTSDKKLCETVINRLITLINEINFNEETQPEFILYEEKDVDQNLAQRDNILFNMNVRFSKDYYKKTYGFEDEDFELREPEWSFGGRGVHPSEKTELNNGDVRVFGTKTPQELREITEPEPQEFSEHTKDKKIKSSLRQNAAQDFDLMENMLNIFGDEKLEELIEPALQPLINVYRETRDYETVMDKIAEVYPEMNTKEIEDNLTKIIFIAEILGRISNDNQ